MLKVKLFGAGWAAFDDQPVVNFPSQQAHLLLCYLLLNAKYPHLRDGLASVFWGDYSTQASRKYLRNALWKLRQLFEAAQVSLDDYLLVSDESVAFICASAYWLDVEAFETAAEACRDVPGQDLLPPQAAGLAEAVELYTGDLLEGVDQDWCIYERERLNLLYLGALGKLMAYHEAQGSFERGLAYGERILGGDNTREKVHLQIMRLYWLSGNRSAALAQYKRCAQILREELGIAPMQETTAVYQQMIHNQYLPGVTKLPLARGLPEQGLQALAEKALQRLQYLQQMLEETNAELRQIESLLHSD
jgi:DNA-binding SARP family transcriptional activator